MAAKVFIFLLLTIILLATGLLIYDMIGFHNYHRSGTYVYVRTSVNKTNDSLYYVIKQSHTIQDCTNNSLKVRSKNVNWVTGGSTISWLIDDPYLFKISFFTGNVLHWISTVALAYYKYETSHKDEHDFSCSKTFFYILFMIMKVYIWKSGIHFASILLFSFNFETPCLEMKLYQQSNIIENSQLYMLLLIFSIVFQFLFLSIILDKYYLSLEKAYKDSDNCKRLCLLFVGSISLILYICLFIFISGTHFISFYGPWQSRLRSLISGILIAWTIICEIGYYLYVRSKTKNKIRPFNNGIEQKSQNYYY
ncbi:unnamed protein product [Didymodactylos carnosus]|uniref:Uncharacterized protein n=2 Tax=Didymodactylos carnosus TaxID=1234261 RepID=A0A814NZS9_9BILA|nr:unnamed protein product [Didymodactylos carnosus]CAF3863892.1 unnamed protein product [Didymodactylos carnosus]